MAGSKSLTASLHVGTAVPFTMCPLEISCRLIVLSDFVSLEAIDRIVHL